MGFTFLPITNHGDLLDLELDQHSALLPRDGSRAMTGDLNLGGNDITGVVDVTVSGDLVVTGSITAGEYLGGSPVHLRESSITFGENDEASIFLGEHDSRAAWIFEVDEEVTDAPMVMRAFFMKIIGSDELNIITPDILITTPDADGTNLQMDDEGAHWLGQAGQLDPFVFEILNSQDLAGFYFDHIGSNTTIYGGNITLDTITQSAFFPEGKIELIGYTKVTGELYVSDKVSFHRTNGTTSISGSVTDGYMDYLAAEQHRFDNAVLVDGTVDILDLLSGFGGAKLGDGGITDYFEIGINGLVTLVGEARVKNKLSVIATGAGQGVSTPTLTTRAVGASGNVEIDVLRFSNIVQNDARVNFCSSDKIDDSVNGHFVLKWIPGASWTTGNYIWVLEYIIKGSDEDITTGMPTTISVDVTPANANDKIETEFQATINLDAGQVLSGHFYRDVASDNADDVGDVERFQFEYTANKLGKSIAA